MCDMCGCSKAGRAFEEKVKKVIDEIRPALQAHGGDIEFISADKNNNVSVRLQGACAGCPGAQMTLRMGVECLLKEKIPQVNSVTAV